MSETNEKEINNEESSEKQNLETKKNFIQQAVDQKEMKARADAFMEAYEKISKKYKLRFVAKITFLGGGRDGMIPTLAVTDIKKEDEAKVVFKKGGAITKEECEECSKLPEGEVIEGHDHRKEEVE